MNILLVLLISLVFVLVVIIVPCYKSEVRTLSKSLRNKVHFYVARDKTGELFLYMGKPFRSIERFHACYNGCIITDINSFYDFDLNKNDFDNLKWEDEPVEVFINMED